MRLSRIVASIIKTKSLYTAEGRAFLVLLGGLLGLWITVRVGASWFFYACYICGWWATIRYAANDPLCLVKKDLSGRVAFVTGANSGCGLHTALQLARMGCTVILGCRSLTRAEEAVAFIKQRVPDAKLFVAEVDVSCMKSVRECAKVLVGLTPLKRLDYLVNNAGLFEQATNRRTNDGMEMNLGTNHYGPFLLTELLLPSVVATRGRVVNVASLALLWGAGQDNVLEYLRKQHSGVDTGRNSYGTSKACNVFYTRELAERVGPTGVKVLALHPGAVATNIFNGMSAAGLVNTAATLLFKTCSYGAQTTLECVLADNAANGGFYTDCALHNDQLPDYVKDKATGRSVVAFSRQVVGLQ
jgi:retinol dehydrogenase 12